MNSGLLKVFLTTIFVPEALVTSSCSSFLASKETLFSFSAFSKIFLISS
ncbi:putative lipoprotein, partial [Chlamydia psittaci 01DC11]